MNKSLLLSIFILALSLCGCTHNDGDIGTLFGEWTMTDLTVDGVTEAQLVNNGYVWGFQSHVIGIKEMMPHNEYTLYWGSWQRDGETLTINYTHGNKPGVSTAPEALFMTDTKMVMKIVVETKHNLTLSYVDPQGRYIMYKLKKQW